MKQLFSVLLVLSLALSATAQTLTIGATSVEVSTTSTKNNFFQLEDLYFTYNTVTGGFEARETTGRNIVYAANISTVTISGQSTAAQKIAYLERTHVRAVVSGNVYNVLMPRANIAVRYKVTGKYTEVFARYQFDKVPLWYGNMDSLKTSSGATTTNLRLADVRTFSRRAVVDVIAQAGGVATVAAGAAAGASPTVTVVGNSICGEITLATGSSTTSTGIIATVTLPTTFPTGARVCLFPSSDVAGASAAKVFATTTTNTIVLNATTTALTASTANFKWHYIVVGY